MRLLSDLRNEHARIERVVGSLQTFAAQEGVAVGGLALAAGAFVRVRALTV